VIRSWQEYGNVWDPNLNASPHTETIDTEPRRHEAFYSRLQIFELDQLIKSLTVTVEVEWALERDGTIDTSWRNELKPNLSSVAANAAKRVLSSNGLTFSTICQVISDRYYPKTQSDERRITDTIIHRIPDVTAEDDPMRSLELVANGFGVNPKPQAVLFMEGHTSCSLNSRPTTLAARCKLSIVALPLSGSSRRSTCARLVFISTAIRCLVIFFFFISLISWRAITALIAAAVTS
jgi:hypothetical protein